jgi:virulence surface antigen
MPITYAGISPTVLIDTQDLQHTEKLSRRNGKLVRNQNGVCMSLVVDWLQKCQQIPGGVTAKSQLKSGLALSLAQTAYMRHAFQQDGELNDASFIHGQGLAIENYARKKKKLFSTKKGRLEKIALACAFGGDIYIGISGDGGHALGYHQTSGVYQFFDPNEGILQFNSAEDFVKWFPQYIRGEYPDLVDLLEYTRVRG